MRDEKNIAYAIREQFFNRPRPNQYRLFQNNFEWMKPYLHSDARIVELGCAHGLSREFLPYPNLLLTDVEKYPWSDDIQDAQRLAYPDESVDVVFSHSILHHLSYPVLALREIERVLRPGGYYLVQDVKASVLFRILLRITRIEEIDFSADPYDLNVPACGDSPWDGNNAIPDLLIKRRDRLQLACPGLELLESYPVHCILTMNSGGTTSFFPYIPMTHRMLDVVERIDRVLCGYFPGVFALQQRMIFRKRREALQGGSENREV
jgi:SAM-dependent methyltransferase